MAVGVAPIGGLHTVGYYYEYCGGRRLSISSPLDASNCVWTLLGVCVRVASVRHWPTTSLSTALTEAVAALTVRLNDRHYLRHRTALRTNIVRG